MYICLSICLVICSCMLFHLYKAQNSNEFDPRIRQNTRMVRIGSEKCFMIKLSRAQLTLIFIGPSVVLSVYSFPSNSLPYCFVTCPEGSLPRTSSPRFFALQGFLLVQIMKRDQSFSMSLFPIFSCFQHSSLACFLTLAPVRQPVQPSFSSPVSCNSIPCLTFTSPRLIMASCSSQLRVPPHCHFRRRERQAFVNSLFILFFSDHT